MNAEELAAIKARAEAASEGPWAHYETQMADNWVMAGGTGVLTGTAVCEPTYQRKDADFIAHSRTDIPALVAEVERLQKIIAEANWVIGNDPKPRWSFVAQVAEILAQATSK